MAHPQQGALALDLSSPDFSFSFEGHPIRGVKRDGEPWFVAADVCRAIGIGNPTKALHALDADEQALTSIQGLSRGNDQANIINESGLYTLILRCRDAVKRGTLPHRFRKWVTAEVLPAIRKHGRYEQPAPIVDPQDDLPTGPLSYAQMTELTRIVHLIAGQFRYDRTANRAVWAALRRAANCPAPNPFEHRHMPILLQELRRLLVLIANGREALGEAETMLIRRVIGRGEEITSVIREMKQEYQESISSYREQTIRRLGLWARGEMWALLVA
ncbi:Bro-N domain-containing protein [Paraburkholderia sp. J10-1]|uniref:BRO-N domain-containing protein n=1 Tax=Paraburkholderia sp. J10-1 TaxID=2805430 RepID=UPI002AB69A2B|nr:BRO family protein [Paraburkholderia sp. J10-1]